MSDSRSSMDGLSAPTGSYDVLLELGRGGMGTVHLARTSGESGFERLVVLKRMHPHLMAERRSVRRFLDEARIASQLHHANVVGIQQVGTDDAGYFLVLDYVEGDTIEGLVARARASGEALPLRVIARVLLDGLEGLAAAHGALDRSGAPLGILHRDVSVQNLLVGRDGITRLTDFGIARDSRGSGATAPGRLVGKPLYMSPEFLRSEALDARVDVYGMGVTAWVALAGREPWPEASDAQIVLLTMQKGLPELRTVEPDIPDALSMVVRRATAADAAARYPTARAMSDALANAASLSCGIAPQAEVAEVVQRLVGTELAQRRKQVTAISGSVVSQRVRLVPAARSGAHAALPETDAPPPDTDSRNHADAADTDDSAPRAVVRSSSAMARPKRWRVPVVVGVLVAAMGIVAFAVRSHPAAPSQTSAAIVASVSATATGSSPAPAPSDSVSSAEASTTAAPSSSHPSSSRPGSKRSGGPHKTADGIATTNPYLH